MFAHHRCRAKDSGLDVGRVSLAVVIHKQDDAITNPDQIARFKKRLLDRLRIDVRAVQTAAVFQMPPFTSMSQSSVHPAGPIVIQLQVVRDVSANRDDARIRFQLDRNPGLRPVQNYE